MKRYLPILLLTILVSLFSGCSGKGYNIGGVKLPTFTQKKLDRSLPTVDGLKTFQDISKVGLQWKPVLKSNIAGYRIFRTDKNGQYQLIKTIDDRYKTHFTDKNINPNYNYLYKISTYTTDDRVSLATAFKRVRASNHKLLAPHLSEISKNYPDRIKLIWNVHKNKEVNSYIVERALKGERNFKALIDLDDRLTVEYIDKDVVPAQIYSYRIRARTYDGIISPPSKALFGYSKKLPNAISWIKATDNLARRIDIIWKDTNPPANISHYNIYSSPMKDTLYTLIAKTRDMKYTDKINSDGARRYYKITAVDTDGLESTQGIIPTLGRTVGASNAPIINSALVQNNAVLLKWSNADGAARSYTVVKKFWDGWRARKIKITDFKATQFTDRKIKPNVQYTYYVIAIDKHGIESIPSREVTLSIQSR